MSKQHTAVRVSQGLVEKAADLNDAILDLPKSFEADIEAERRSQLSPDRIILGFKQDLKAFTDTLAKIGRLEDANQLKFLWQSLSQAVKG